MTAPRAVTLQLLVSDAEPILRDAARKAARFGAYVDHFTRRTGNLPCAFNDEMRRTWQNNFVTAKRMVEAFGVGYEPTSEQETLTVDYPWEGGTRLALGNTGFHTVSGQVQNFKKPFPSYRREIHSEACAAAAERVVRAWRAQIGGGLNMLRINGQPTGVHTITETRMPGSIQLKCTCGWWNRFSRSQNALARAAKVRAAVREHSRDVAPLQVEWVDA